MKVKSITRNLVLRNYQEEGKEFAINNDVAILAMCPGAGKTETAIGFISTYINLHPKAKILVLAHSTTVLKDNFFERLESINVDFEYSIDFDSDAQVHISLPQSKHKIKDHYDVLIVDEAHENYLEKQVQDIIRKVKPKKQLLLTGTPSKFIKKGGYSIFTKALNELSDEYFAKLSIELIAIKSSWKGNYNTDLNLKREFENSPESVKESLKKVVDAIYRRLETKFTPEQFNSPSFVTKMKQWAFTYKNAGKTLFVCKSVKHANDVYAILKNKGVNCTISEHQSDRDSKNVSAFKNGEYDVLVVVNRARLGYSDDQLMNIVEMSGTMNIDLNYQLLSRVVRGDKSMQKFLLKITTTEPGMMDYTHATMCGALMLTDNKYLSTFNGNNFNGIVIPVVKSNRLKSHTNIGSKKLKEKLVFPEFTNDVVDMFRNIIHNLDNPVSIYKTVTMAEVRSILTGRRIWTEEKIWASARGDV